MGKPIYLSILSPLLQFTNGSFVLFRINSVFHTSPNVLHYRNSVGSAIMMPGQTFTIEPMICMGKAKPVHWNDKWTAATIDGLPSAQFEHTLLITETGVEELTGKLPTSPKYFWEL